MEVFETREFEELGACFEPAICGYKAYYLSIAISKGLPVPPGFVLTTIAQMHYMQTLSGKAQQATGVGHDKVFLDVEPGQLFVDHIKHIINLWAEQYTSLIVRSSAVDEDLLLKSHAGHYLSVPCLPNPQSLERAISTVWHDAWLKGDQEGRADRFDRFPKVALLIQPLLNPICSGVYFESSPISEAHSHIEACWGLSEPIVKGVVTPDIVEIGKNDGNIASWRIGEKDLTVIPANWAAENIMPGDNIVGAINHNVDVSSKVIYCNENQPMIYINTPHIFAQQSSIDENTISGLYSLSERVRTWFNFELDLEWVKTREGLYLVQIRPITGLNHQLYSKTNSEDGKSTLDSGRLVLGTPASGGLVEGRVFVIRSPDDIQHVMKDDIIVCRFATPSLMPALILAAGFITSDAGVLCHLAIVARELGKPCVVGVEDAVEKFSTGSVVRVDGTLGTIGLLDTSSRSSGPERAFEQEPTENSSSREMNPVRILYLSADYADDELGDEDCLLLASEALYDSIKNQGIISFLERQRNNNAKLLGVWMPNPQASKAYLGDLYRYLSKHFNKTSTLRAGGSIFWFSDLPEGRSFIIGNEYYVDLDF